MSDESAALPTPPGDGSSNHEHRLWTPWRMRYVGGHREPGCVFCNRLASGDDVASLILWRGERAFVIMNLFPYNTGHVMLVPNDHVAGHETADPAALSEMATTLPGVLRALRRVLNCGGFNIGTNVGDVAGAGVAEHLHEHVVPRWTGDANFMPILASTMVLPELIPVTDAKLRTELARDLGGATSLRVALLDRERATVLARDDGSLPDILFEPERPGWATAASFAQEAASAGVRTLFWAGPREANGAPVLGLDADAPGSAGPGLRWLPIDDLEDGSERAGLRSGVRDLASVDAPGPE